MLVNMMLKWVNCKLFPFFFFFFLFFPKFLHMHCWWRIMMYYGILCLSYDAYNKRLMLCWWIIGSRLGTDGQEFFTSYDEVFESFDAMGLQENLLRGIYAYGMSDHAFCFWKKFKLSESVYLVEAVNATHRHMCFPVEKKNVMILDFFINILGRLNTQTYMFKNVLFLLSVMAL